MTIALTSNQRGDGRASTPRLLPFHPSAAPGVGLAQRMDIMATDVADVSEAMRKACELSYSIARSLEYGPITRFQKPTTEASDFLSVIEDIGRELSEILEDSRVRGSLSLANPQPITVANYVAESHAACMADIARFLRVDIDLARLQDAVESYPGMLSWHCLKECERAAGINFWEDGPPEAPVPKYSPPCCPKCTSDNTKVASTQRRQRHLKCNDCGATWKKSR